MSELKIFKGKRGEIAMAVMNAFIPPGGAFKAGASDYDLLPDLDRFIGSMNNRTRMFFPLILRYVQYVSLFYRGKVFTRLSTDKAIKLLEGMEQSKLYFNRSILMILKLMTTLLFFNIDEVAEQIGYIHGCHLKEGQDRK